MKHIANPGEVLYWQWLVQPIVMAKGRSGCCVHSRIKKNCFRSSWERMEECEQSNRHDEEHDDCLDQPPDDVASHGYCTLLRLPGGMGRRHPIVQRPVAPQKDAFSNRRVATFSPRLVIVRHYIARSKIW